MIEVSNISFAVGKKHLLKDVSLSVKPGELLAIIGSNGAGKSTLLKLMCKDILTHSGDIRIRGKSITHYRLPELAKFRSVLAQSNTLSLSFQVEDLVVMGRYPHYDSRPSEADMAIVRQVMADTGITELAQRDYNTLSGGEQQRVQLARVMAQIYDQPKGILFLDEPTNGLDLLYQQQILSVARAMADRGYCIVCILHDINFAARFADNILILKNGERIAFGSPQEVITKENIQDAFNIEVRLLHDEDFRFPVIIPVTMETKTTKNRD